MLGEGGFQPSDVSFPEGDGPARAAARPGIGKAHEPFPLRRFEQLDLRREPLGPRLLRDGQLLHEIRRSPRCRRPHRHAEDASPQPVTRSCRLRFLAAFPAYRHPQALLLLMPMMLIVARIGQEREEKNDKVLELKNAYQGTSYLLGDMIEADDAYTGSHSRDVVELVLAVAERLGLDADEQRMAEFTALLHDVGKLRIPASIINKPGALDDEERALMNTHTVLGQEMLERAGGLLGEVGPFVRSCHEHWDGNGYPDGLLGEEIPLVARIVCTCDAWSAMTTDRSYRRALSQEAAAEELRRCAGSQFDPKVVDALVAVLAV